MTEHIYKKGKLLAKGFTTGSCAQAAAKAAAIGIITGSIPNQVEIYTNSGEKLNLCIVNPVINNDYTECSVIKYSGDDPDVTNGIEIKAKVSKTINEIIIDGGSGVGRVTKKGLHQDIGEAAINPVPRKMIEKELKLLIEDNSLNYGLKAVISAVNGEKIAEKTFNARLGIIGGISILGTSGIVEPMSEKALIDTIYLEIDSHLSYSKNLLFTIGNYGRDYAIKNYNLDLDKGIKISNYIGEALDYARFRGAEKIMLIGHSGKLIKIAGGIMNTHSSYADCRQEIFAAYSALMGADKNIIENIFQAVTTDDIDDILSKTSIYDKVWEKIIERILFHLNSRLKKEVAVEVLVFTNKECNEKCSKDAKEFIKLFEG